MRNEAIFFLAVGGCAYALLTTEVPDEPASAQRRAGGLPITAVVRQADVAEAARAIHTKFDLGGDEPAVVYAGTGR